MSFFSYSILRSYYIADPVAFAQTITGNGYVSQLYQTLVYQILESINNQFNSIHSTVTQLDFDGNVMFANNDAVFGMTKSDIKNMPGSVSRPCSKNVLISDVMNKKALILEIVPSDVIGTIQSNYATSGEQLTQDDVDFIKVSFSNVNIQLNTSTIIWEYQSDNYITSFYLVPEDTRQILIYDDAIRDSSSWIRQGQEIKWVNNSSKPISIYSGKTDLESFNLDPDLTIYGKEFESGVIQPGESYSYKFVTVSDYNFFIYPDILTGSINVTESKINSNDQFLITENDNLDSPTSSRVIKVDSWGNVIESFGESYILKPRKGRPLLNNGILIST